MTWKKRFSNSKKVEVRMPDYTYRKLLNVALAKKKSISGALRDMIDSGYMDIFFTQLGDRIKKDLL